MGLLISHHETLQLSSEGRSYALRIIRVHRLWEKYLADETGVDERDWHHSAEEFEHKLTPQMQMLSLHKSETLSLIPTGIQFHRLMVYCRIKTGKPLTDLQFGEFANYNSH